MSSSLFLATPESTDTDTDYIIFWHANMGLHVSDDQIQ